MTEEQLAVLIHHALIQGCQDGTYFEPHEYGLVVNGCIDLTIVARYLLKRANIERRQ
jgi:hypothetical protein